MSFSCENFEYFLIKLTIFEIEYYYISIGIISVCFLKKNCLELIRLKILLIFLRKSAIFSAKKRTLQQKQCYFTAEIFSKNSGVSRPNTQIYKMNVVVENREKRTHAAEDFPRGFSIFHDHVEPSHESLLIYRTIGSMRWKTATFPKEKPSEM